MASSAAHPPLLRRIVVSVVVVALLLGLGALAFRGLGGMRKPPGRTAGHVALPVVRAETLAVGDVVERLRGYGVVEALEVATVAAEIPGVVREVSPQLRVGRIVLPPPLPNGPTEEDAEALVVLDTRDLQDAIDRAEAERAQANAERARLVNQIEKLEAQLEVTRERRRTAAAELERIQRLVPDTLTESDLDRQRLAVLALQQVETELEARKTQAQDEIASVDARLQAIAVTKRQAERDLQRARVHAPFPGVVTGRHVEVGQRVAAGTALFDLLDPSRVAVSIALPARRWGEVAAGQEVRLRLGSEDEPVWTGPVARVGPAIDAESRTFRAYVEVEQPRDAPRLAPGAHVVADVDGRRHEAVLAVPREAFLGDVVYVVEPTDEEGVGVARARRPRIEVLLPGEALVRPAADEDADGLHEGDVVVVSNLEDIAEGSRLEVATPERASEGS